VALTDTFVRNLKLAGSSVGSKHTDGQGLYLHVKRGGKYWRMGYRYAGRQKTLALGVYPATSLAKARQKRDKARELLAEGIDPNNVKREEKFAKVNAAGNSFKSIALEWHAMKVKSSGTPTTYRNIRVGYPVPNENFHHAGICCAVRNANSQPFAVAQGCRSRTRSRLVQQGNRTFCVLQQDRACARNARTARVAFE
jgi:hypothetical protein